MELLTKKAIAELARKMTDYLLSDSEYEELQKWIVEGNQKTELTQLMEKHWQKISANNANVSDEKIDKIYKRILEKLAQEEVQTKKARTIHWGRLFQKVAAILILPLLAATFYLYIQQNPSINFQLNTVSGVIQTVEVAPGVRSHFYLPDSTEVWLNSQSKLKFSTNMVNENTRTLKLEGQAYFNVQKDKRHPFIVETDQLNVKVVGTSFDLSAYSNDDFVAATLEEGKVEIIDDKGQELLSLVPGQQSYLNINQQKIWKNQVETSLYTSWKDGYLIFNETPIQQIARQLERWFNCKISLSEQVKNSEFSYNGTIHDEVLEEVLKMLQLTTPINYEIINRNVTIW